MGTRNGVMAGGRTVPAVPSSFVGRDVDVAAVARLLAAARLVTLTGPPGVGKTRLAVEAAAAVRDGYPDGVWLAELADAGSADGVCAAVAEALGLGDEGGASPATLTAALGDRRLLLVLDSCEHLVDACGDLVGRLLVDCAGVSVLATSQQPLGVGGEMVWQIEPLAPPGPHTGDDPAVLAGVPAVALFMDRAVAQRPDFALTPDVAPAVAEITRRLDGLPLAIELAAASVTVLPPAEIARRLADRLSLPTAGRRAAGPRHQTLRAALEWSHDLLTGPQRVLFRRLAVFAGGFAADAAARVCAGDGLVGDEVPALLRTLVDRCLVASDAAGRHHLLDTTRAYAELRLDASGESRRIRDAHLAWCLDLAERAAPQLAAGDQHVWLSRLDAEHDNLVAALAYATAGGDSARGLRLAAALVVFWSMRGRLREGLAWLDAAAAAGEDPPEALAAVRWGAGLLARLIGDYPTATARGEEALELAGRLGATRLRARSLCVLGAVGVSRRTDLATAEAQLEEAVVLARETGDSWCEVAALAPLGLSRLLSGRTAAARRAFEQCLAVADRAGAGAHHGHRLHALVGLGRARLAAGDHREATGLLQEALELSRALQVPGVTVTALRFLGEAALVRGDLDQAEALLGECVEASRNLGSPASFATALLSYGRHALARGDAATARRVLSEARSLATVGGVEIPGVLVGLGAAERLDGNLDAAGRQLDEALAAARRADDEHAAADALREQGRRARAAGDHERADALLRQALTRCVERDDRPGTAACLEALGGVAADGGAADTAARLFAAAHAIRDAGGFARAPADQSSHDADLAAVRHALGDETFAAAWREGRTLSPRDAAGLGGTGTGLTRRQRDVALLAAERLSAREIGERLGISPRTVQAHLRVAYAILGVSSRAQLAELVDRWAPARDLPRGQ